jgi:hypothetical protein
VWPLLGAKCASPLQLAVIDGRLLLGGRKVTEQNGIDGASADALSVHSCPAVKAPAPLLVNPTVPRGELRRQLQE